MIKNTLYSPSVSTGIFEAFNFIGAPAVNGDLSYDNHADSYNIRGSGEKVWGKSDQFVYLWKFIEGDFILRAELEFSDGSAASNSKAGWMVRKSLAADSQHVSACLQADGKAALHYRAKDGEETESLKSDSEFPTVIQLERKGDVYIFSTARFGETFTHKEKAIELTGKVQVGLFSCAQNANTLNSVVFRNVRIVKPAWEGLVQYTDYLGSHLELLELETGKRTIVHSVADSLQAPNWTTDGKHLIYNRNGKLYTFNLTTGYVAELDTDFAVVNNNDHVLSFDGKQLGISHHAEDADGESVIYTVPATGGIPKRITMNHPSFLHGWSPDAKSLIYTAGRNGEWSIYKISSEGGEETALTKGPALDDGSEYSPDGEYIYFNSVRTGLMQIWRMKPDGSEQEQLTDDECNNWFPHISHDSKSMVYIAYNQDIDPSKHPFYKHVYLRQIPVDGGEAKVIAYLYGGQGSFNVPSYSPDGKYVAFVSNTII